MTILGTSPDFLNDPAHTKVLAQIPASFWRFQVQWAELNPSPGVFNWTTGKTWNDAIYANAVALGKTMLVDIWWWPAWVQADWPNRFKWMTQYVTAFMTRYPRVQILGVWNEPSTVQSSPMTLLPGNPNGSPLALMQEYDAMVRCVYTAKQAVNPKVQLNIGKFDGFNVTLLQLLQWLGTWQMGDYITWHYRTQNLDPMVDTKVGFGVVPSAANQVQLARAWFPGKLWGSDEFYLDGLNTSIQSVTAFINAGASMLIDMLTSYQPSQISEPAYAPCCGVEPTGLLSARSKTIINILTMPSDACNTLWAALNLP